MTIPEMTEAIEGASAVLSDMSAERPDPRLALVIAALGRPGHFCPHWSKTQLTPMAQKGTPFCPK